MSHYAASLLAELIERHPKDQWYLLQTGFRPYVLPESLQRPNVSLRRVSLPNRILNSLLGVFGLFFLDYFIRGMDVWFAPNLGFINVKTSVPLVLTVHDLSFAIEPKWYTLRERWWHRLIRPGRLARRATAVIAVSKQTKRELTSHYHLPVAKVRVVYPGIDRQYFSKVAPAVITRLKAKYGLPPSYFLFLGSLEPRKNFNTVLLAYELARKSGLKSGLVLAGQVSDAAGRGITKRDMPGVSTLGFVEEADKPALYAAATALVLVSYHEGFGFPPLEALACGTPSIVSDIPVFTETLGQATVRIPPSDHGALAEQLLRFERQPSLRSRIIRSRPSILAKFTWRKAAQGTYNLLEQAAKQGRNFHK